MLGGLWDKNKGGVRLLFLPLIPNLQPHNYRGCHHASAQIGSSTSIKDLEESIKSANRFGIDDDWLKPDE